MPDRTDASLIALKRDTYSYFLQLRQSNQSIKNIEEFKANWQNIAQAGYPPKNLTVILHTIARYVDSVPQSHSQPVTDFLAGDDGMTIWAESASQSLNEFNSRDCAQSLWSLAKIGIVPSLPFLQRIKNRCLQVMEDFTAFDITETIWSFASLGVHPGEDFIRASNKRINDTLSEFNKLDYTKAIRGLTILSSLQDNRMPSGLIKTLLKKAGDQRYDAVLDIQLDMAGLWFNLPQHRRSNLRVNETTSTLKEHLSAAFQREGIDFTDGVATHQGDIHARTDFIFMENGRDMHLHMDGPGRFVHFLEENRIGYNGSTHFHNALLKALNPDSPVIRVRDRDNHIGPESDIAPRLKNLFNATAPGLYALDYEPGEDLVLKPLEKAPKLEASPPVQYQDKPCSKTELMNYFKGLEGFKSHREFATEFLPRWQSLEEIDLSQDKLAAALLFTSSAICSWNTPLSIRGAFLKDDFFAPWYERAARFDHLNPAFLSSTLTSFANMGILPHSEFMSLWQDNAIEQLADFGTEELISSMQGFAKLGLLPPRRFTENVIRLIGERMEELSSDQLTRLSRGLAIFYAISGKNEFRDVSAIFLEKAETENLDRKNISRNNHVRILLDMPLIPHGVSNDSPSLTEELMEREFISQGFPLMDKAAHFIPQLNRKVDFIFAGKSRKIILEMDGPAHFIRNDETGTVHFNGSTQFQTALLNKVFPDDVIIRLNYLDVIAFKAAREQHALDNIDLIERLGTLFKDAAPGMHQSCFENGRLQLKPMFGHAPPREKKPVTPNPLPKPHLLASTTLKSPRFDFRLKKPATGLASRRGAKPSSLQLPGLG